MALYSLITDTHHLVVKIGSNLITGGGRGLDQAAIAHWTVRIAALRAAGKEVVLVSSSAVTEGIQWLGWARRPKEIHELQTATVIGWVGLAQAYESEFARHNVHTAQVLPTHGDLAGRECYLDARSTLLTLLNLGVVPVINENDTVVADEIKFDDNDTLGVLVTNLIKDDALIVLTNQHGLYTADPHKEPGARFVDEAQADTPDLEQMADGTGSGIGRDDILTKILAIKRATESGAHTVIASGREADMLTWLTSDEAIGAQLRAPTGQMVARKQQMIDHLQLRGRVVLDAGAVEKLTVGGKSLLPIGVTKVQDEFVRGKVISYVNAAGRKATRRLTNYPSAEARLVARKASSEIEAILGYVSTTELVHRDNPMLL